MKRKILIIALWFYTLLSYSQVDTIKTIITTKDIGHFLITTHDSIEIKVKLDKVKYLDKQFADFPESDVSITIENSENKIVFIKNLSAFNNSLSDVKSIELYGLGKALIFFYDLFPCYGKGCSSFQIFGFNDLGYFVPFTGIIDLSMGYNPDSVSNYKVKWLNNSGFEVQNKIHYSYYPPDNQMYLEVPDYIDYCELTTLKYYPIYNSGVMTDKDYKETIFEKIHISYNNSNFKIIKNVDDERLKEPIFLYSKPDTSSNKKIINLKVNSVIKFIDGFHNNNYWVHLRIDGVEGYILWRNLYNLGLEPCD